MRVMLDASYLIDHLKGDDSALRRFHRFLADGDELLVSLIAVCEVETGLAAEDDRAFAAMLAAVEFVQAGPDAARDAGRWRREARRRGGSLSLSDALIAADAHHSGAAVLTRNVRDFAQTPVTVLTY